MGQSRIKYSCTACHRRKIKCNKVIPCENCVKRGLQDSCSREDQERTGSNLPDVYQQPQHDDIVSRLLGRVAALEQMVANQNLPEDPDTPGNEPVGDLQVQDSGPTTDVLSSPSSNPDTHPHDAGLSGAVSVLEFLAWGRRKDHELHEATAIDSGPSNAHLSAGPAPERVSFTKQANMPQLELLQTLLPAKGMVLRLVEWHAECLLWYHGSYNSVVFKKHLEDFYSRHRGDICQPEINMQWVALLFAILTGSLTCSSTTVAMSWGFRSGDERAKLSFQWYQATVTCLNVGDYLEVQTLYSAQAISTLTISAHTIGLSNSQSVLLASANRIAQSLGLSKLKRESDPGMTLSQQRLAAWTLRETGRRLWVALCTQDWFSIPFSDSYALNPDDFTTEKPLNCNDGDPEILPADTPTITSYCNYHYDIAALMPRLQVALAGSNTLYTKYEHVLAYDEKMRQLVTACMPTFLSTQSSVPSNWPIYVPWARRGLAICAAHKIMMIHRMFIGLSFTNNAFALTRRTCIAASKTILKEAQSASDDNGPVLWIEQAFVVAAGIILALDALHRGADDPQRAEHESLTKEAANYLRAFKLSMIASRGTRLLSFLGQELASVVSNPRKRRRTDAENEAPSERARRVNMPGLLRKMSRNLTDQAPDDDPEPSEEDLTDIFAGIFPPQTGFTFDNFFEWESPHVA